MTQIVSFANGIMKFGQDGEHPGRQLSNKQVEAVRNGEPLETGDGDITDKFIHQDDGDVRDGEVRNDGILENDHNDKVVDDKTVETETGEENAIISVTDENPVDVVEKNREAAGDVDGEKSAEADKNSAEDFDSMTVQELKDYATVHKIDISGLTLKDDIKAAVVSASK